MNEKKSTKLNTHTNSHTFSHSTLYFREKEKIEEKSDLFDTFEIERDPTRLAGLLHHIKKQLCITHALISTLNVRTKSKSNKKHTHAHTVNDRYRLI